MSQVLSRQRRLLILMFFLGMLGSFVWGRFFFISIWNHSYYLSKAATRMIANPVLNRGSIFLTDKDELPYPAALNKDFPFVYAVPKNIKDPVESARKLAPILGLEEKNLLDKLSKPNDPYEVIKKKISGQVILNIKELNLEGIGVDYEIARFYPLAESLAQVIGFLGFDQSGLVGQYGLESFYNDTLQGSPKSGLVVAGKQGLNEGADLVLTIDSSIQDQAFLLIQEAVKKWQADGGSIVVMDPKSGAVRAMTSYPSFDSNDYASIFDKSLFLNPLTQRLFEPGSVLKPLTLAVGLDIGVVTPEATYYDSGEVQVGSKIIRNSTLKGYGLQTMTGVLEKSLNTGAVFVQQKIPKEVFAEYFRNFGLSEKTGTDLPEVKGDLSNLKTGRDINYATAAFGQGISMTSMELLRALGSIANGGVLPRPHLVERVVTRFDSVSLGSFDSGARRVISPETAAKLTGMMIKVIESGTGGAARISGYSIAGKTGTAQVPNVGQAGYSEATIHSFAGFAPAYNPRFIALVKLDDPKGVRFAESTAVPVFHDLASFILSYWQIPPDKQNDSPQN